ncbi:MAG: thiamine phosphate synthase [Bacteroidales bacterium]|jgi:thiamine-phosphate pyrophosphorylase|nr:thiamine phosphate synthase [Bacteroidales bacterium]
MRLIIITHSEFISDEAAKINALFKAGMEILHIRKLKSYKKDCVALLEEIDQQYHPQIKIHDFFDLADHYPVLGVHLNCRNPVYRGSRKLNISKSCHTIEELNHIDEYDYVFLSPIFNSISKPCYTKKFTEEVLQKACKEGKINNKVIALGGINADTLPLLKEYTWGGAAVLGSIWKTEDVVSNFLKLKKI